MFKTFKYTVYSVLTMITVIFLGPAFVMMLPMMIALVWSFFGVPPQELATIAQWGFDHGVWNL